MSRQKYSSFTFPSTYLQTNPYHPQIPHIYDPTQSKLPFHSFENSQYFQGFPYWEQSSKLPEVYHPPNVVQRISSLIRSQLPDLHYTMKKVQLIGNALLEQSRGERGWECRNCSYLNCEDRKSCRNCEKSPKGKEKGWECGRCRGENSPKRSECCFCGGVSSYRHK